MLLTGGQISVAISSAVVCIFTTLLFLSGYVLQQQTIRSLQAAIKPNPLTPPAPTLHPILAKHFGRPPGHNFYDKYLASNRPKGGWAKVAYVQLLRSHSHVCNAFMTFAALEGQESMAQRILMYPSEWDLTNEFDAEASTSARLLRDAASRYKVMLQPISPHQLPSDPTAKDQPTFSDEERFPLTNLLSLFNYNRILYLQPSGLILSSTPLDLLFSFPLPKEKHMLGFTSPIPASADRPPVLLIEPSKSVYQNTMALLPEGTFLDTEVLALLHTTPAPLSTPHEMAKPSMLLAETSALHNVDADFNATDFMDSTGYVHIQDEGVLGPEFEADETSRKKAPSRREARKAWEGVYERYREGRMEICGLDLQSARKEPEPERVEVAVVSEQEQSEVAFAEADGETVLPETVAHVGDEAELDVEETADEPVARDLR